MIVIEPVPRYGSAQNPAYKPTHSPLCRLTKAVKLPKIDLLIHPLERFVMSRTDPRSHSLVCSSCGQPFLLSETDAPPFCSQRCKMIDLGRWLDEEVEVPHEGGPRPGDVVEGENQSESQSPYDSDRTN